MATDYLLDRVVAAVGEQYLVEQELGRGGMAVVYRALDLRLQRRVAIKALPPELSFNADVRERFLREAQTAAQLSHPNIVPIFTVDERGGVVYFVMGLVEGETLGQIMKRAPRRPVDEVARVLQGVADALAYAHRHGVIHRDIKPDNVIVDAKSGRPMVTDFGIARAAAADSRLTVTGITVGTPTYMSPEQAIGERDVDGRSDIYALGVVGFQLLTGEPPFVASNAPALLMKHVSETPRQVASLRPDTPPALAGAIMRALAKQPEERWKDAESFRDAVSGTGAPGAVAAAFAAKTGQVPASAPVASSAPPRGTGLRPPPAPVAPAPPAPPAQSAPVAARALSEPPEWLTPKQAKRWREAQFRAMKREMKEQDRRARDLEGQPVALKIAHFRRKIVGNVTTMGVLVTVNALTSPDFWWCLFPAAFMTLDLLGKGGSLWADGVSLKQVFGRRRTALAAGGDVAPTALPQDRAAKLVGPEVLAGAQGAVVRRAAADQGVVAEVMANLGETERGMIPDVLPTAQALAERVATLATTMHRIDDDVSGRSLDAIDARLAELRAQPEGTERERRVALLERQRESLAELLERRRALEGPLESAVLALENLKLDLLKLRSAGLSAGLDELTTATQQARALSRDIGHAVEAAEDVKKL